MKNFNDIYVKVLKASKSELEVHRRKVSKRIILSIIGGIILFCFLFGTKYSSLAVFVLIPYVIISAIFIAGPSSTYRRVYKTSVIKTFVEGYDENLRYLPESGIRFSCIYWRAF